MFVSKLVAKMGEIQGGSKDARKPDDAIQYELCYNRGAGTKPTQTKVTELESRLQRLESVLGAEKSEKLVSLSTGSLIDSKSAPESSNLYLQFNEFSGYSCSFTQESNDPGNPLRTECPSCITRTSAH